MALNASKVKSTGNKNFVEQPALEPGVYPARVVQVIGLGLQPQRPYQGKAKPPAHIIHMTYELVDVFMLDEDGNEIEDKPRWVFESFPLHSLEADRAKSTMRYNALDPQQAYEGDFSKLINTPCQVTVVVNRVGDRTYENVANVSAMRARDEAKCPELQNPMLVFDPYEPDLEAFERLPEWIRNKIKENLEYRGSALEALLGGEEEEAEVKKKAPKKAAAKVEEDEPPFDADEDEEDDDEVSPY